MSDIDDIELLKELGETLESEKQRQYTPIEARLIAGFEDILKFSEEHNRSPQHGSDKDIFERIYAVRLDQIRKNQETIALLSDMDTYGLLRSPSDIQNQDITDQSILSDILDGNELSEASDITELRNVSPMEHRRAAEEIANREVCHDFKKFEPLFKKVAQEIDTGVRQISKKTSQDDFEVGRFFILKGQTAFIAERGKDFKATGKNVFDARLRVIFDNGTESPLLMRSLQRAFNDKKNDALAISEPNAGPLFGDIENSENQTGTIYLLKTKSEAPEIIPFREAILKIGVTGGDVKTRTANAKNEATYLLADVEIVTEFDLYNINRQKLEKLLHSIFAPARLDITIKDRFGKPFQPREWFIVTPEIVKEAVDLIKSNEIINFEYDHKAVRFIERKQGN